MKGTSETEEVPNTPTSAELNLDSPQQLEEVSINIEESVDFQEYLNKTYNDLEAQPIQNITEFSQTINHSTAEHSNNNSTQFNTAHRLLKSSVVYIKQMKGVSIDKKRKVTDKLDSVINILIFF